MKINLKKTCMLATVALGLPLMGVAAGLDVAGAILGGTPPAHLAYSMKGRVARWTASEYQLGTVKYDTWNRMISVFWEGYFTQAQVDLGEVSAPPKLQKIPVGMYPTDFAVLDSTNLIVGGRNGNDRATLERLVFNWRAPMPTPVTDAAGNSSLLVVEARLQRAAAIYTAGSQETGRKDVRHIWPMLRAVGSPTHVLVQFEQSREVVSVELTTAATVVQAKPEQSGTALRVPELSQDHRVSWTAEHSDLGYIYVLGLRDRTTPLSASDAPAVVLIDGDKDGTLDSYQTVLQTDWDTSTFADSSKLIRVQP